MFPIRLKELRKEQKISQAELGKRVHVSQQAIAQWESGATSPAPEMVALLAEILSVSTDYLLGNSNKKEPATVPGDGQAQKLAQILREAGVDVDRLTEAEMWKVGKIIKAAFEE